MTPQQRKSLHVYCRLMAEDLNKTPFTFRYFLKVTESHLEVPWTKELFKKYVFKPVLESQTEKESTEDMDNIDPSDIHRIVDEYIASKFGVSHPWPDRNYGNV